MLALTPPFNLPAPGRRQSVYVVYQTSHRPMFLVNSRHHQFTAAPARLVSKLRTCRSTPSSEVTGSFCRVPWPEFSRAPWIIHPTHLSWFPVRFANTILRRFSRQSRLNSFRAFAHGLVSQHKDSGFACYPSLHTCTGISNTRPAYRLASLHRASSQVREY